MILVEVGEIGVCVGDKQHVLRPSLYAMTKIGDPKYIVEVFATVMSEVQSEGAKQVQFGYAYDVVTACCEDDITEVFGYFNASEEYQIGMQPMDGYVPGLASTGEILILARALLTHGVVGGLPELPKNAEEEDERNYSPEFLARDHVSNAIAHLGMSEKDAWNCTMTSLVGALRSKFPPNAKNAPGMKAPTKGEHEQTMEWFDAIEKKRLDRAAKKLKAKNV